MQLSSRQDIEAPIGYVFERVTDFTSFERQALRRGADVRRRDSLPEPGVGSGWDVTFTYRNKERLLQAEVIHFEAPNNYLLTIRSGGISGETLVDLVPLSRRRTRLSIVTELAANGLSARLLLQSLRLAKTNLTKRMGDRVASYAADIEERFARQE